MLTGEWAFPEKKLYPPVEDIRFFEIELDFQSNLP